MTSNNPCIKTVTTTKIVDGQLKAPQWGGNTSVRFNTDDEVYLKIDGQIFSKTDLVWLADRLTEIAKAL